MFAPKCSVLFFQLVVAQFSIYVKFLSVYGHVLLLVVALQTVMDMMIDIHICFTPILYSNQPHIHHAHLA